MTKLTPDEESWIIYQAIGTWVVAMTIVLYELFGRHFQDQGALPFAGMLLGLPIMINVDRKRRKKQRDDDEDDR